jgi:hypothetical protein
MLTISHNEWNNDPFSFHRRNRPWNYKQVHAEILWIGFNIRERKISVPQAWFT